MPQSYRKLLLQTRLLIATMAASIPAVSAADLEVTQITKENAARTVQSGPDAIGGIGDWFMTNGVLCAVIADVTHETEFSAQGGVLVDLGYCDRADDHYTSAQDLLDGKRTRPVNIHRVAIESSDDSVSVITYGGRDGMEVETRYTLNKAEPQQLHINKRVTVVDDEQEGFNLYAPATFNYHSLETFTFSSTDLSQSKGFANEEFVSRGVTALKTAARNVDTIIAVGPADAEFPISYGWQLKSARRHQGDSTYPVPRFALSDDESMAMLVLVDDFYIGDGSRIGLLQLPQLALMSLDKGDQLELEEVIYVGKAADVASITDQVFTTEPTVSGISAVSDSAIHIDLPDGTPVSHVRSRADGSFKLRLPAGEYQLRHLASADRSATRAFSVAEQGSSPGRLELPEVARLALPRGEAMRLVFLGRDGTNNPDFTDTLTNFSVLDADGVHYADEVNQIFLAGIQSDLAEITLVPGKYRVYATRGPEYSLETSEIELRAGETQGLRINTPQRQLKTPGFIAADFHVHAGNSFDNTFSNTERVRNFVAEHGEVMVSSEHDVSVDFAPIIEQMGVADKITSITGIEMTSSVPTEKMPYTGGHVNFFPFATQAYAFRKGMISHEDRRLREVLHDIKQSNPTAVSQLNHPRKNLSLSGELPDDYADKIDLGAYFDHMGTAGHPYNPSQPIHSHPNNTLIEAHPETGLRDIDVDALELLNPGGEYHQERLLAVRKDWISLLQQGFRIAGTANSDSHKSSEQVAVPRNMVSVQGDSVESFKVAELLAAIRSGNLYGTTGPMLNVSLSGVGMGATHQGTTGTFDISIDSADWIPVERVTVQVNGQQVIELDATRQRQFRVDLEFRKDSFVTLEVHGPADEHYAAVYPGITPYAFTNPIYVDYESDGNWQPPGLPLGDTSDSPGATLSPIANDELTTGANPMPKHEKINYLEYAAKDIEATKAFFTQAFGWEFEDYGPDYAAFSNEGVDGGFYRADLSSSVDAGGALTVFYSDDLEATEQKVIAAGGEVIKPIFSFPGGRRFHFTEPSGNEFAVWGLPEPE